MNKSCKTLAIQELPLFLKNAVECINIEDV